MDIRMHRISSNMSGRPHQYRMNIPYSYPVGRQPHESFITGRIIESVITGSQIVRNRDRLDQMMNRNRAIYRQMVLFLLACQENSDDCANEDNRCYSDKQPFKCMKSHCKNCCFRIPMIPSQVRHFQRR